MILSFLNIFLIMIFIIQGIAFITLYERHLLGGSQQRIGPNKVSYKGVLQAIFDGIKLLKKEQLTPLHSADISFLLVPGVLFTLMYLEWFVLPYFFEFMTFEYSVIFLLALVGFSVYATLVSGVVSSSKYGLLGAIRAGSQSVSYEIAFAIYFLVFVVFFGSFSFIVSFNLGLFLVYLPFMFMILAELQRAPFDFAEGESELVSGYNVEFSSVAFVLLFMSEYGSLLLFSALTSLIFFNFFCFGVYFIFSILIFIRSSYPRYRYDMMMNMFWFEVLPLSLFFLWYYSSLYLFM